MCVGMSVCMFSTRACTYDGDSVAEAHLDLCVALIAVHSTLHAHDTLAGQLAEHQPTLVAHHCNTVESIARVYIITANLALIEVHTVVRVNITSSHTHYTMTKTRTI